MKLLSEHKNDDETKTAKVFYDDNGEYVVVVKTDTGSYYNAVFKDMNSAEYFAEEWVVKDD
ncbi:MAG: hypothetical protein ACO3EE_07990 [Flavobacteriales bacterium]